MTSKVFFCDTYAIIELIGGNLNYRRYIDRALITSDLNLMELYYSLLRDYGEKVAETYFQFWSEFSVRIPREIIRAAMMMKLERKADALSYVDCMGYVFAVQNRIQFLTGDVKFRNMEGVEFVK